MNDFKIRWDQHNLAFINHADEKRTSLSKYLGKLKEVNKTAMVKWKILKKAGTCRSLNEPCFLCVNERLAIIRFE